MVIFIHHFLTLNRITSKLYDSVWSLVFIHVVHALCVSVSLMRQGEAEEGLGEEMYEAFKNGEEIPQADVEITDDDPSEVRRMKELIVEMTAYEASDRPTIHQVLAVLSELNAQVRQSGKLLKRFFRLNHVAFL